MLEFTIRRRIGQRPSPRAERDVRPRETSHETCFVLGDHFRSLLKAKGLFGGRTRARTWDPLIKSQLLYQLSYAPGSGPEKPSESGSFSKATCGCPASQADFSQPSTGVSGH